MFVEVNLVSLDWIVSQDGSEGHKLLSLIPILESIDDEELYTTPFIDALKEATIMLKKEVINYCFIPFLLQLLVTIAFFSFYVQSEI